MLRTRARDVIKILEKLFSEFGAAGRMHADGGPPFSSRQVTKFLKAKGVILGLSSPYHPQSNGAAEQSVAAAKAIIKKCTENGSSIADALENFNNFPRRKCQFSPMELFLLRPVKNDMSNSFREKFDYETAKQERLDYIEKNIKRDTRNKKQIDENKFAAGEKVRVQDPETKVWNRRGTVGRVIDNERREILLDDGSCLIRNCKFIKHEIVDPAEPNSPHVDRAMEKPRSHKRVRFRLSAGQEASSPPAPSPAAPAAEAQQNLRRSTRIRRSRVQVVNSHHSPHQHTARHSSPSLTTPSHSPPSSSTLPRPHRTSPSTSSSTSPSTPRPPPATLAPLEPILSDPISSAIQRELDKALGTHSFYYPASTEEPETMGGDRHDTNTFTDSRAEYSLLSLHSNSVVFTLVVVVCLLVIMCLCRSNVNRCYRSSTLWRGRNQAAEGAGGFQGAGAAAGGGGGGVAYFMPGMQGAHGAHAITCSGVITGGWKGGANGGGCGGAPTGTCPVSSHVHGGERVDDLHLRP